MAFRLAFLMLLCFSRICYAQTFPLVASKLSASLAKHIKTTSNDSTDIVLVLKNSRLGEKNHLFRIITTYHPAHVLTIRTAVKQLPEIAADSNVVFLDLVKTPHEELTTGSLDLAANKLNLAHRRFPAIRGNGILVSIKEQQFDTTDIDYSTRYLNTGAAAATFTTHASIMATTAAGAGNSSPYAVGAAPAAQVTSTSFAALLPESDAYYQQANITLQNHSYGTVVENYYGAEAAAYDQSVRANPTLVHVFSAGNSGTAAGAGPYAGVQGWGNLTGNFKTAKNVLVVGAIDSFYQVAPASSKGPAFDGRVKPELVAFGEDGSSGAAALVSGTAALVQQAYAAQKNKLPSAALVKAALLNSADALQRQPLSHAAGYGSLNGYNAVKTIVEKRFFEDTVQHGVLKKFALQVPPHAAALKVTLSWTEEPAAVNAAKALVNDLDLVLKNTTTGEHWLPWVLSASPQVDSITKKATRQKDTVNTNEQITLAAPKAGSYILEVTGDRVTSSTQAFAIAYQLDTTNHFEWTFPTANDAVMASQAAVLRWQTTIAGTAAIEYKTSTGDWKLIADSVNLALHWARWTPPDTLATAQLRMRFSKTESKLTDTFVISKPLALQTGFNCTDSFLLYWNALSVSGYQLYNLGSQQLEPVNNTNDTMAVFKNGQHHSAYYSVAPLIDGRQGVRSITVNYTNQGVGCYVRSFYLQAQDEASASLAALFGTTYNIASISIQKWQQNNYVTLRTITLPATTNFVFTDTALLYGANRYRLLLTLGNGAVVSSAEAVAFHFPNTPVFVYPNPVRSGQPLMLLTRNGEPVSLQLFNTTGALVRRFELNAIINRLVITLPRGVYFLHALKEDGSRTTQKLVVY